MSRSGFKEGIFGPLVIQDINGELRGSVLPKGSTSLAEDLAKIPTLELDWLEPAAPKASLAKNVLGPSFKPLFIQRRTSRTSNPDRHLRPVSLIGDTATIKQPSLEDRLFLQRRGDHLSLGQEGTKPQAYRPLSEQIKRLPTQVDTFIKRHSGLALIAAGLGYLIAQN